jgi:hypothetical protein
VEVLWLAFSLSSGRKGAWSSQLYSGRLYDGHTLGSFSFGGSEMQFSAVWVVDSKQLPPPIEIEWYHRFHTITA